ncbi:MAG: TlpA family protein disulfide reductase [Bacteroidia bacterium]
MGAQNVTIKGKAHESYKGRIIQLFTFTDFITNAEQKEGQDTIHEDGFFDISFYSDHTQPVILKIGNVFSKLYVQPDFVYGITIPELDENKDRKNDAELFVNIGIIGTDSTELNALIFSYQELYNKFFLPKDNRFLGRNVLFKRADSLKKVCDIRYKNVNNPYFKNYYEYSIGSVNASLSRGENYLINNYIINKPIQYQHYEYMQFFNACFSGYLNSVASAKKGQSLYNIINTKASYSLLDAFLKDDKFLKDDSLRELVILQNLWDFYYRAEFSPEAIEMIVSDLNLRTKIAIHKKIATTMLTYFNKMQPGSIAPDFSARSKEGTVGSLNSFKNRWIYLSFFSTKNIESLKEMPKIAALKKKFGDKLVFVSVCLDDSLSSYQAFIKNNPKYDWVIWYNYDKNFTKTAKDNYFVTGTEAYFLINNYGYLAQSPAPAPSKGIEFKLNSIFKIKSKTTKTGIR